MENFRRKGHRLDVSAVAWSLTPRLGRRRSRTALCWACRWGNGRNSHIVVVQERIIELGVLTVGFDHRNGDLARWVRRCVDVKACFGDVQHILARAAVEQDFTSLFESFAQNGHCFPTVSVATRGLNAVDEKCGSLWDVDRNFVGCGRGVVGQFGGLLASPS